MIALATLPFFIFAASKFSSGAEQQAIASVLERYAKAGDYLSAGIVRDNPQLGGRVANSHIFVLPARITAVERAASGGCPAGGAQLIVYDGEHWESTPMDEQADMPGAIGRAKRAASSGGCTYGIAPDGQYIGITPASCTYDLRSGVIESVDWRDIALFNIQAQRLLSDKCASQGGLDAYVSLVRSAVNAARSKGATTKISAQFSFRYTPPDRMIEAMHRLNGVVDGFYLAYPEQSACKYCSPENLQKVLSALPGR